jgi:hypothetical protein
MGLSNTSESKTTFVSIIQGKFTVRLRDDDDNPNAVTRELTKGPNKGKEVKELQFTKLDGMIVGGEMRTDTQYPSMDIFIDDGEEKFTLQVSFESDYFGEITKRLPNIDPAEPVVFLLGFDKEGNKGKGKPFLYIKQSGATVKYAYTKDNPNGLPPWGEKQEMGKTVPDKTDYNNFLYGVGVDFLASVGSEVDAVEAVKETFNATEVPPVEDDEEVPF